MLYGNQYKCLCKYECACFSFFPLPALTKICVSEQFSQLDTLWPMAAVPVCPQRDTTGAKLSQNTYMTMFI